MKRFFIGIDLGGTSMKMGVVNEQGRVIREIEKPTLKEEGADGVIGRMICHARNLAKEAHIPWKEIQGIGVGLPGFLDIPGGVVKYMTNLGWTDIPIRDRLVSAWQVPVKIDNDANAAALGEVWSGAGSGEQNAVCITLGTGVGGGIIAEGKLLHGAKGFAGEIGHIQIDPAGHLCNCGQTGCLETISSATGMVRSVHHAVLAGEKTSLAPFVHDESLSTRHIFAEANRGDAVARKTIDRAIHALAQAMATLSVVINPSLFIIGGGVSQAGEALLLPLGKKYQCLTQKNASQDVRIVLAQLGNRAGFIGAAGLLARL